MSQEQSIAAQPTTLTAEEVRAIVQQELEEEREKRRKAEREAEQARRVANAAIAHLQNNLKLGDKNPWTLAGTTVADYLEARASEEQLKRIDQEVDQLFDEIGGASQTTTETAVRENMVKMHRKLADFRNGDDDMSSNFRRGIRLFRRFIWRLDPEETTHGIKASYGKLKMTGDDAKQILDSKNDLPKDGVSKTVWRAMGFVVEKTKPDHCDCDEEDCSHALFARDRDDGYTLTVDQDEWSDYLNAVTQHLDGVEETTTPDDEGTNSSEGSGEPTGIEDEFDQLAAATPEHESADTVVSGEQASASAREDASNKNNKL